MFYFLPPPPDENAKSLGLDKKKLIAMSMTLLVTKQVSVVSLPLCFMGTYVSGVCGGRGERGVEWGSDRAAVPSPPA